MPTQHARNCIHEAGHAIAVLATGGALRHVKVTPDEGEVSYDGGDDPVIIAAGMGAERLRYGRHTAGVSDAKALRRMAQQRHPMTHRTSRTTHSVKIADWCNDTLRRAEAVLQQRMTCVIKLARALYRTGSMTGAEVERCLKGAPRTASSGGDHQITTPDGRVVNLRDYGATLKRLTPAMKSAPGNVEAWTRQQLELRAAYLDELKRRCEDGSKTACEVAS